MSASRACRPSALCWVALLRLGWALRTHASRSNLGRRWWLLEHLEGGSIWELAVKEAGLDPNNVSTFGRHVPKYPRSVVEQVLALNQTKVRDYNFQGIVCFRSYPGTTVNGVDVPEHALEERRRWAVDFASKNFGERDFFLPIFDAKDCSEPTSRHFTGVAQRLRRDLGPRRAFPVLAAQREYLEVMSGSRFTLCPAGEEPWSTRIFEAALTRSLPVVSSRALDVCPHVNGNVQLLQAVYNRFRMVTLDQLAVTGYREDWVDENLRTFIKYHTFMEGDNVPDALNSVPECSHSHGEGRQPTVLLVIVGLPRNMQHHWAKLLEDVVLPNEKAGYSFRIVVHTSTEVRCSEKERSLGAGCQSAGLSAPEIRRLFEPRQVDLTDSPDHCRSIVPDMTPGETCEHEFLAGVRRISCGTMHFASRAVQALDKHHDLRNLDKVLVIRSDRHLVPSPPPSWSHVRPGIRAPVRTEPVYAGWFNLTEACRRRPGLGIVGSAQITNGFAEGHDPDWAWLLCDGSQVPLLREALAAVGLPCERGCRKPQVSMRRRPESELECGGPWCRTAALLEGRLDFGTLEDYALAAID